MLLMHLLKSKYQPAGRSNSWRGTISEQRRTIKSVLGESPSLRPHMPHILAQAYPGAVEGAALEAGLPEASFAAGCEWPDEAVLEKDFLPD